MKKQLTLIIEHCEPTLSDWLLLEYKHSAKLWDGELIFTRVTEKNTAHFLKPLGIIEREKATEICSGKQCIVLDPQAKKQLTPQDCTASDAIIIGGLLGYEKPQGRTKKLISDTSEFPVRHLGKLQLSIDGAVFVAKAISLGLHLKDIEIAREIEIVHDTVHSTILPFGYPIINNKPVITPGLVDYLMKH